MSMKIGVTGAIWIAGEGLAALLERENQALRAIDLPGVGNMLADKTRAIDAFLAARRSAEPPILDAALRERATALAARLATLAAENRQLLDRAIKVQGRVLDVIARAVPTTPTYGYRPGGRSDGPARPSPLAVSARA